MAKKGERKAGAKARSVRDRAYNARPEQKKRRAERNKARRAAVRNGTASKGDGKDVHHPGAKKSGSLPKKTRLIGASSNRSMGGKVSKPPKKRPKRK